MSKVDTDDSSDLDHSAFEDSDYWNNREAWAHHYSQDLASALGINIDQWVPNEGFSWAPPKMIFDGTSGGAFAATKQADFAESSNFISSSGYAVASEWFL